jgi:hypothetical protein
MVGQDLVAFILFPITALSAVSVGITVLLAWFLLRGSRVAWVLAVLLAAAQLAGPLTQNQPMWVAGIAAIFLACLLAPPLRAFVWTEGQRRARASGLWLSATQRLYDRLMARVYGWVARVSEPGGRPAKENEAADKPRGKLIVLLVVCVLILDPLVGMLYDFHHGSRRGSVIVDVLWRVVWIGYTFVRLALIVLLAMAAYRYLNRMVRRRWGPGAQKRKCSPALAAFSHTITRGTVLALGLCVVSLAACGASSQITGCYFGEPGEFVRLHNSGLKCAEASATLNVLPSIKRPQEVSAGGMSWVCVYYPPAKLPIRIYCGHGKRYFTLEETTSVLS